MDKAMATGLYNHLVRNDYVDDDGRSPTSTKKAREAGTLAEPTSDLLKPVMAGLWRLVDALYIEVPLPPDGRTSKRIPLNEENFAKREFQELWDRINHKAVYQVDFDSSELILKCKTALDRDLKVARLQYVVKSGQQKSELDADDLTTGEGFSLSSTDTRKAQISSSSQVEYDLLGQITEKTKLTRRTVSRILSRIEPVTFGQYRQNPEQFITEAARLINEQKATVMIERLTYDTLTERYDTAIFTESQTKQDFTKAGKRLKKHIVRTT
ncbi:hypothetical protein CTI14_35640 [Methylobacterium radiotolerans]|nr:hypothetical protein CTI14_35640 [Methylobacterium radiotolerans]